MRKYDVLLLENFAYNFATFRFEYMFQATSKLNENLFENRLKISEFRQFFERSPSTDISIRFQRPQEKLSLQNPERKFKSRDLVK